MLVHKFKKFRSCLSDTGVLISVPAVSLQLFFPYACAYALSLVWLLSHSRSGSDISLVTYHPHKLLFVSLNSVLCLSIYYAWNGLRHKLYHFLMAALSKYYRMESQKKHSLSPDYREFISELLGKGCICFQDTRLVQSAEQALVANTVILSFFVFFWKRHRILSLFLCIQIPPFSTQRIGRKSKILWKSAVWSSFHIVSSGR